MKSQFLKVGSNFVRLLYEPNYTCFLAGFSLLFAVTLNSCQDWLTEAEDVLGSGWKECAVPPLGAEGQAQEWVLM